MLRPAWSQIVPALLIGLLIGGLAGQRGGMMRRNAPPEIKQERMVSRFSRKLRLDDEQKAKLRTILSENRKKMEALRVEAKPKFESLHKSMSAEIRAILRPDQLEKFDTLEKDWSSRRGPPRGFPPH